MKKDSEMKNYTGEDFVPMQIPLSMFGAVCALLGGASLAAVAVAEAPKVSKSNTGAPTPSTDTVTDHVTSVLEVTETVADGEVDAHGHPWNEELHASTKGKTKDGLWRMKVGVSRPDPVAGFTVEPATSTTEAGTASPAATSAPVETVAPTETSTVDEDDEFAAFSKAAADANAADEAAKASVPARKWTDADLGSLCNQAAVKLGDPAPIKEIIAAHVAEGEVAHSRNIPEENREAFAKAVEAKAGIEFAG
jgi:hypothetical protein